MWLITEPMHGFILVLHDDMDNSFLILAAAMERICSNKRCKTKCVLSPEFKYKQCEDCRQSDKESERARREKKAQQPVNADVERFCNTCTKVKPLDQFEEGHRLCNSCTEQNRKQDAKRDQDHVRELARKNQQKPERREHKKEYREENRERHNVHCKTYRDKKRKAVDSQESQEEEKTPDFLPPFTV